MAKQLTAIEVTNLARKHGSWSFNKGIGHWTFTVTQMAAFADALAAAMSEPSVAVGGDVQQFTAIAQASNRTGCIGTPGMPFLTVPVADATPGVRACATCKGNGGLFGSVCTDCNGTGGVKGMGHDTKSAHPPIDSEPTK